MELIRSAKVPIIKLTDRLTRYRVDISFNQPNGLVSAKILKGYLAQSPAMMPLLYILKQYLLQRGLNEPYNGHLGGYALAGLLWSFLQVST